VKVASDHSWLNGHHQVMPVDLQNAMSMQAQAERERQARVILGDSEKQVAAKFEEAAKTYQNNPTALHLRAHEYAL
jgi:hypothetical protein